MKNHRPAFIYGTAWKKQETARLVELALNSGFRAIDTANQLKHYDEAEVGKALASFYRTGGSRESLFIQSKFTGRDGQDHRLPYDENADLATQVVQSLESSLAHLATEYLDAYLLHGPYNYPRLGTEDWEVWAAMEAQYRKGLVKQIGVSNVNALQLVELLAQAKVKPSIVQNRCYANRGWDRDVREICKAHDIMYQGFSLLTANSFVLVEPIVVKVAARLGATPAQTVFRFATQIGIVPLTGTSQQSHMTEDLGSLQFQLSDLEVAAIENII